MIVPRPVSGRPINPRHGRDVSLPLIASWLASPKTLRSCSRSQSRSPAGSPRSKADADYFQTSDARNPSSSPDFLGGFPGAPLDSHSPQALANPMGQYSTAFSPQLLAYPMGYHTASVDFSGSAKPWLQQPDLLHPQPKPNGETSGPSRRAASPQQPHASAGMGFDRSSTPQPTSPNLQAPTSTHRGGVPGMSFTTEDSDRNSSLRDYRPQSSPACARSPPAAQGSRHRAAEDGLGDLHSSSTQLSNRHDSSTSDQPRESVP